jgi:hypothetical protein
MIACRGTAKHGVGSLGAKNDCVSEAQQQITDLLREAGGQSLANCLGIPFTAQLPESSGSEMWSFPRGSKLAGAASNLKEATTLRDATKQRLVKTEHAKRIWNVI